MIMSLFHSSLDKIYNLNKTVNLIRSIMAKTVDIKNWKDNGFAIKGVDDELIIEQYVQDALDFSSQYGSDISISYTAYNISGRPSKYPDYGDFPQAFVMV